MVLYGLLGNRSVYVCVCVRVFIRNLINRIVTTYKINIEFMRTSRLQINRLMSYVCFNVYDFQTLIENILAGSLPLTSEFKTILELFHVYTQILFNDGKTTIEEFRNS